MISLILLIGLIQEDSGVDAETVTSLQLRGGGSLASFSSQSNSKINQNYLFGLSFQTSLSQHFGFQLGADLTKREFRDGSIRRSNAFFDAFVGPYFQNSLGGGRVKAATSLLVAVPNGNWRDQNFQGTNRVFEGLQFDVSYDFQIFEAFRFGLGLFSKIDLRKGIREYNSRPAESFYDLGGAASLSVPILNWTKISESKDSDKDFERMKELNKK